MENKKVPQVNAFGEGEIAEDSRYSPMEGSEFAGGTNLANCVRKRIISQREKHVKRGLSPRL